MGEYITLPCIKPLINIVMMTAVADENGALALVLPGFLAWVVWVGCGVSGKIPSRLPLSPFI